MVAREKNLTFIEKIEPNPVASRTCLISLAYIFSVDLKFTGNFWKSLRGKIRIQLNFSSVYHLYKDGQAEMVN